MGFETGQVRKLRAKLKPKHVRSRRVEGAELHYLEGWHVIAEANRIFGFDGWDRETVETKCVWTKQNGSRFSAAYVTRVRITVKAGDTSIVREGSGAGEAHEVTPGMAHDRAAKAAETDATKRALMTFGNAFGLSLYAGPAEPSPDRSCARSSTGKEKSPIRPVEESGQAKQGPTEPGSAAGNAASAQATGNAPSPQTATNSASQQTGTSPVEATVAGYDTTANSTLPPWPTFDPLEEAARIAKARGKIDKSQLAVSEPRRERDPDHLKRVASRPCLVCGRNRAQAHHLTYLQPRAMGRKVSDEFTVPLCSTHHRELHSSGNEKAWWAERSIDPKPVARALWQDSRRPVAHGKPTADLCAQPQAKQGKGSS
jgi:DNA recombination protein Rad52